MNKYQLQEVIGDGTFGVVIKAIEIRSREVVAVKKLKQKVNSEYELSQLTEVKVLRDLRFHDNIVKLRETVREPNGDSYLVFDYEDQNLYTYISRMRKKSSYLPEKIAKDIIYQIASGLAYMHSKYYFHRDLKPENILISKDNKVRIADFGSAKKFSYGENTDYICTRWYRAPECLLGSRQYDPYIDIWALGAIAVELLTFEPLFPGTNTIDQVAKISDVLGSPSYQEWPEGFVLIAKQGIVFPLKTVNKLFDKIDYVSELFKDLMLKILKWNPKARLKASQIVEHPLFSERSEDFANQMLRYPVGLSKVQAVSNDFLGYNKQVIMSSISNRERNDKFGSSRVELPVLKKRNTSDLSDYSNKLASAAKNNIGSEWRHYKISTFGGPTPLKDFGSRRPFKLDYEAKDKFMLGNLF